MLRSTTKRCKNRKYRDWVLFTVFTNPNVVEIADSFKDIDCHYPAPPRFFFLVTASLALNMIRRWPTFLLVTRTTLGRRAWK